MPIMKSRFLPIVFTVLAIFIPTTLWADHSPTPTAATIAGSLQDELGCPGDWQPDCAATHLTFDTDDTIWQGTFNIPAGSYEYKAALSDSWDENYGANAAANGANIQLNLGAATDVKFYYSHDTHWITDNVNSVIATAAGSFQSELGCTGDWQPDCLRSWLQDTDGDGIYTLITDAIPGGSYEFKVTLNEDWTASYPAANVPFTSNTGDTVTITFDSSDNSVNVTVTPSSFPSVTITGSLQDELGCPGDWQPDCADTHLVYDSEDDVWQDTFNIPAGSYEYKAALNDSWDETYGDPSGANIPLVLGADTDVKFYYSHQTHWITDNINAVIAAVAGNFQDELGCSGDWQPDCLRSWLQDPDGDGLYSFSTTAIPAGNYEAVVAHDESWSESYGAGGAPGGPNIQFSVPVGATVGFEYDLVSHILTITGTLIETEPTYAIIHYFRADGDYGDHTTGDFNDFWGLHLWGAGIDPSEVTDWTSPKPFLGETENGRFAWVKLVPGATDVNFIVHRGDVKDGTDADRQFDPSVTQEIWLRSDDGTEYSSQAEAEGFVTIHYHRDDGNYGDPTSTDFNDFWGLHLWGSAIDPSEATAAWDDPKRPDGFDSHGPYFRILLQDASQPVNFIVHRGDEKDPGPDQSMDPLDSATIWLVSGDTTIYEQGGDALDFAIIHYHRDDGDYGDPTSSDYNDYWGLHVWEGAANPNPGWTDPIKPAGQDEFGIYFKVDLLPAAPELAYIIHKGDLTDPGNDQFLRPGLDGYEVWQLENADPARPYILPISTATPGDADGDGVPDADDICPGFDDDADTDGDTLPDGCDACPLDALNDADGDGVCGDVDVCVGDDAIDTDNDSVPDDCDICPVDAANDADGDGFCESEDNCPLIANADQSNNDGDNDGDACDADDDNDGIDDTADNCPLVANGDQSDYDGDGAGDVCDMDVDGDGVLDNVDNCPYTIGTGVVDGAGCSINQYCTCENSWKNHGAYVRCVAHTANVFISQGLIDQTEHGVITSEAGNSDCGARK